MRLSDSNPTTLSLLYDGQYFNQLLEFHHFSNSGETRQQYTELTHNCCNMYNSNSKYQQTNNSNAIVKKKGLRALTYLPIYRPYVDDIVWQSTHFTLPSSHTLHFERLLLSKRLSNPFDKCIMAALFVSLKTLALEERLVYGVPSSSVGGFNDPIQNCFWNRGKKLNRLGYFYFKIEDDLDI